MNAPLSCVDRSTVTFRTRCSKPRPCSALSRMSFAAATVRDGPWSFQRKPELRAAITPSADANSDSFPMKSRSFASRAFGAVPHAGMSSATEATNQRSADVAGRPALAPGISTTLAASARSSIPFSPIAPGVSPLLTITRPPWPLEVECQTSVRSLHGRDQQVYFLRGALLHDPQLMLLTVEYGGCIADVAPQ